MRRLLDIEWITYGIILLITCIALWDLVERDAPQNPEYLKDIKTALMVLCKDTTQRQYCEEFVGQIGE